MTKYVTGMRKIEIRIQKELMAVKGRTYAGMIEALRFLEKQMDTVNPVVPVSNIKDKVHLRDTFFILGSPHPTNPIVFAGYRAEYAPIVHENLRAVNWTRTGSGPKWLQIHYDRNRREMFLIVAANVRVPRTRTGATYTKIGNRTNERNVEF